MSDKSRAMSEMKRERGRFKEERLKCQFPQSSKTIKMEKGLLDEIIRPLLVSREEKGENRFQGINKLWVLRSMSCI